MQWFKFYGQDFISDPKMGYLTTPQRLIWIYLLSMASQSEKKDGVLKYVTLNHLRLMAGITENDENWKLTEDTLELFEEMGMVTISDETLTICNYKKYQEQALTGAERQARYREKRKENEVNITGSNGKVTNSNDNSNTRVDKSRVDNNLIIGKNEEVDTSSEDENLPNGMSTLKAVLREKYIIPPKDKSGITKAFQDKALRMAQELGITLDSAYRSRWLKVFKEEEEGKKTIWSTNRAYSYLKDYLPSEGRSYTNENKIKHFFWLIANGNAEFP